MYLSAHARTMRPPLGMFGLRFGQPADKLYTKDVDSVVGQRLVGAHYPGGTSSPSRSSRAAGSADRVVVAAANVDGVATASKAARSADVRWVRVEAVLDDPPDSPAAKDAVHRIRDLVHAVPGADALVGASPRPRWTSSGRPAATTRS